MRSKHASPIPFFIVGGIMVAIGLAIFFPTIDGHIGWEEVTATYQDSNCNTEMELEHHGGSARHNRGGKTQVVEETYCDRTIQYQYKGQDYTHTETHVRKGSAKPSKRLVDPNHPERSEESHTNRVLVCFFCGLGVFFSLFGIAAMIDESRRNKK